MNLTDLYDAILNGKLDRAVAVTNEAISEGVLPNEIITNNHKDIYKMKTSSK